MFATVRTLRQPFRTTRLQDKFQLVLSKGEVQYDYVGVDVTTLISMAARMAKNIGFDRRNREIARMVVQHVHQIVLRFHAKKGLALFLDGSEGLHKAHLYRSSTTVTKRVEARLQRLPGMPLIECIEERVVRMMPENRAFPPQVMFSGSCVAGPAEMKMSAWALDVATSGVASSATPTQLGGSPASVCLIGGTELFLNVLALTPFVNVSSVVQQNADFKQLRLQDILTWFGVEEIAEKGDHSLLSMLRTDLLFLYVLCNGCSTTEFPASTAVFSDVVLAYLSLLRGGGSEVGSGISRNGGGAYHRENLLFAEQENSVLALRVSNLCTVLSKSSLRKLLAAPAAKSCSVCERYLEFALQTHRLLCVGDMADPLFVGAASAPPSIGALVGHLEHLRTKHGSLFALTAAQADAVPLTAAEYTVLSQSQSIGVESLIYGLVGVPLKADAAKAIVGTLDVVKALSMVRSVLQYAHPGKPKKTLCFSPSYCWIQNPRSKLWKFEYIDLGKASREDNIRLRRGSAAASGAVAFEVSQDGPCTFQRDSAAWVPVGSFPLAPAAMGTAPESSSSAAGGSGASPTLLRLLTWNVMFDRHSGKPTPLGMPGIDWCSPKRYPVLSNVMRRCGADVIGLQEVEPAFWQYLANEDWVRENYVISCNKSGPPINPWGVLMLVHRRLAIVDLVHHNVPAWSGHVSLLPVVTVQVGGAVLSIAVVHLLAPFTKNRETARTSQDSALRLKMTKTITGDCITMGDFNDWPTSLFEMPAESNYVDAWPLLHPRDPGKTMDETNTFCKLKIEELFFGRSDKVFFRTRRWKPIRAALVGTKSVNAENGNNEAPSYLFPSDHYGVEMDFVLT